MIDMKKTLLMILLLLPSVAFALDTRQICLNSSHLQKTMEWTECSDSCIDYNITQTINCTDGCDVVADECKPKDYMIWLYVAMAIIALIIIAKVATS